MSVKREFRMSVDDWEEIARRMREREEAGRYDEDDYYDERGPYGGRDHEPRSA